MPIPPPVVDIEAHVVDALKGATMHEEPFPWFFAREVFPFSFYLRIQQVLDTKSDFHQEKFANRHFADTSGIPELPELDFMQKKKFLLEMLHLFEPHLQARFAGKKAAFARDLRLIRDNKGYKIGPHTDAPWKVLSLLFYLPADDRNRECGTRFYAPRDPFFRCPGGPHHSFEGFDEVGGAPYEPNTCLGFWKTDQSFHGVPPIQAELRRDVLLYNIYTQE